MFCYFVRKELVPAITVMNGQAVCDDHTYYTQGGEFTKILTLVKRDEERNKDTCKHGVWTGERCFKCER